MKKWRQQAPKGVIPDLNLFKPPEQKGQMHITENAVWHGRSSPPPSSINHSTQMLDAKFQDQMLASQ